jgi:voltage-gated potassium channel Kch
VDILIFIAGVVVVGAVLVDVFQTIVVPRPSPGRRLTRYIVRPTWRLWRWLGERTKAEGLNRDGFYGLYAPGAAILGLIVWLVLLVFGYGLILFAIRGELDPAPANFGSALYFAGTSVLTLGYGDIVASGPLARGVALIAAANGLGLVALVITFLFSLFASYQRRERLVVTLSARAKAPPSAVTLLEVYSRLGMVDQLPELFAEWEKWEAEVLDSHVAYPLLGYFRSSHDNVSWLSALGAVLDAAALVLTTIKGLPRGQAELTKRGGAHLVEDIGNIFGLQGDGSIVDRGEFDEAYARLSRAGYELEDRDQAWRNFERGRRTYAGRLEALAAYWATPATVWIGTRHRADSVVHRNEPIVGEVPQAPGVDLRERVPNDQ